MRIRKFAGNILGTGHYNPWQPPAVINPSTDVYVCILNQDTWDLNSSHPDSLPPSNDLHEMQERRKVDKMKTFEPMSVVSSTTSVSTDDELFDNMEEEQDSNSNNDYNNNKNDEYVALRKLSDHIEEESRLDLCNSSKEGHQKNPNPFTFLVTKGKRSTRKKKKNFENSTPLLCKKTDGKKWRCRRMAQYPNTWCEYHLQQMKSYGKNYHSVAVAAGSSKRARQKRVPRPAAAWAESDIYYYYSDFGPWRGKRVGGDNTQHPSVAAKAAEEKSDSVEESRIVTDASDEDWDVEEKNNRKKTVKLRSLKSLEFFAV